jgi:hypothetical protein
LTLFLKVTPADVIYFKLYRSQLPVIKQSLETAARMLGSDRSRGYCLEVGIRLTHQAAISSMRGWVTILGT